MLCNSLAGQLPNLRVSVLTGERELETTDNPAWMKVLQSLVNHTVDVLVMSPDIFLNLLVDERDLLRMTDVSLIVLDEAHNCSGRHPYAKIMGKYTEVEERYGISIAVVRINSAEVVVQPFSLELQRKTSFTFPYFP